MKVWFRKLMELFDDLFLGGGEYKIDKPAPVAESPPSTVVKPDTSFNTMAKMKSVHDAQVEDYMRYGSYENHGTGTLLVSEIGVCQFVSIHGKVITMTLTGDDPV